MPRRVLIVLMMCTVPTPPAWAEEAPLLDLQGAPDTFSAFVGQGKWTVAMIWASYCGVCNREAPDLEAFHRRYQDKAVQVVGLSVDGKDKLVDANAFALDHGLTFPSLVGDADDIALLYHDLTGSHMTGTPSFIVFDPRGRLQTHRVGAMEIAALERLVSDATEIASNNMEMTE